MVRLRVYVWIYTLPKTNIAPENRPFPKENHLPTSIFRCYVMLVSGRVPTIKPRNEHLGPAGFPNRSSRPGWKHASPCGDWIHGLSRLEKQRDSLLNEGFFGLREGLPNFVTRNGWHKISDIGGSSHSIVFEADSMLFVTSHVSVESFIDQFFCEQICTLWMWIGTLFSEHLKCPASNPSTNQLASFPQKLCKDTVAIALYPKKLLAHKLSPNGLPRDYQGSQRTFLGIHGTNVTWYVKRLGNLPGIYPPWN